MSRRRVLYVNSTFRTYERRLYEALASEFDVSAILIGPPPASDVDVMESLRDKVRWTTISDATHKLHPRDVRINSKLFFAIAKAARDVDVVISGTSDSWKARVVYAAARARKLPIGLRKERWHDAGRKLAGMRKVYWSGQERLTVHMERTSTGLLVGGQRAAEYAISNGVPREQIYPFRYLHADLAELPLDREHVARLEQAKAGRVAFLYLGRVMRQKGLLELIRAFRAMLATGRDAVLFAVGGPITKDTGRGDVSVEYYEDCQRAAAGEPRIHLFGPSDPARVQDFYRAADVFIHPHVAFVDGIPMYEGWGNVITEAMSMSKPVITTTRVASAYDVIDGHGTGFMLDAAHVEDELVRVMAQLVDDRDSIERSGRAARTMFEHYVDPAVNIETVHRLIDREASS